MTVTVKGTQSVGVMVVVAASLAVTVLIAVTLAVAVTVAVGVGMFRHWHAVEMAAQLSVNFTPGMVHDGVGVDLVVGALRSSRPRLSQSPPMSVVQTVTVAVAIEVTMTGGAIMVLVPVTTL